MHSYMPREGICMRILRFPLPIALFTVSLANAGLTSPLMLCQQLGPTSYTGDAAARLARMDANSATSGTPAVPSAAPFGATSTLAEPAAQSASMFDALAHRVLAVTATVEVHADMRELETSEPDPFVAGGQDVLSTAGTFGDVSRYLQTLPGVVSTSDLSNEVLVRGGHPMENLFLVDGIEVPNINHLATMGTTGGFGPMIDSGVIQGIKVYTGGFDARYPERLSSVTEIRTLNPANLTTHAEA